MRSNSGRDLRKLVSEYKALGVEFPARNGPGIPLAMTIKYAIIGASFIFGGYYLKGCANGIANAEPVTSSFNICPDKGNIDSEYRSRKKNIDLYVIKE